MATVDLVTVQIYVVPTSEPRHLGICSQYDRDYHCPSPSDLYNAALNGETSITVGINLRLPFRLNLPAFKRIVLLGKVTENGGEHGSEHLGWCGVNTKHLYKQF